MHELKIVQVFAKARRNSGTGDYDWTFGMRDELEDVFINCVRIHRRVSRNQIDIINECQTLSGRYLIHVFTGTAARR